MPAASLEDLRVRADKLVRRWTNDKWCGCYAEQSPRRVSVGCLSFVVCETCAGRVTHGRRRLVASSALV